jgi:hypothetical protein
MVTHLAIMREPYLTRVLAGRKSIEARFLRVRAAPYGRVAPGDRIWLKRSGGPIVATAQASEVHQHADLAPAQIIALIEQFQGGLQLDDDFIARAQGCRYAVLIWLANVQALATPIHYPRRDRRGWVVLEKLSEKGEFEGAASQESPFHDRLRAR